jgi:serine/threonine protein kinase
MKVNHIPCGPPANESESKAVSHLKTRLESTQGEGEWILLSNLAFSINHQLQSDEIDIILIGPPGVKVLEVKHWNARWMESNTQILEKEAERVTDKARRIGTTLRHRFTNLPRVDGAFLLTDESLDAPKTKDLKLRGVRFYTLKDWKEAIGLDEIRCFNNDQVRILSELLEPKCAVILEGNLRRFAGIVNLELLTPKDERFHRAYRGSHSIRQDRVILHLYDISATQEKNAERKARREFEALHQLQLYPWAPRILDSFQSAPGYPGEMFFFTIVDPAAPTIADRANDSGWGLLERIDFTKKTIGALSQMHVAGKEGSPIIHRNLTPKTILVCHDGTPILSGFDLARIPFDSSIGPSVVPSPGWEKTAALEVRESGLSAADQRSDVYSLCASLRVIFEGNTSTEAQKAMGILQSGLAEVPEERVTLEQLSLAFSEMVSGPAPPPAPPASRYWSEGQVVRFRDHDYRIVTRLGAGGIGTTFKVIEVDQSSKEELGTFVAKTAHSKETGERVLKGYNLARSHLGRHPGLSGIYEVATQWRENDFVALLTWIEGTPLADYMGVFLLLAEDQQEPSVEALAIRWLRNLCESLDVLHHNGLIHGDISPKNIIVSGGGVVLTDYDFVSKIGKPFNSSGTILYCSSSFLCGLPTQPSDDIYALAASFFHVIFDKEPFLHGGNRAKERGLNWTGINRDNYPVLASFLDKATNPDPTLRYQSARAALEVLYGEFQQGQKKVTLPIPPISPKQAEVVIEPHPLREEQVEWLISLLQSYPGSRWGNRETRGLDTPAWLEGVAGCRFGRDRNTHDHC